MTAMMNCFKNTCQLWNRKRCVSHEPIKRDQNIAGLTAADTMILRTDALLKNVIRTVLGHQIKGHQTADVV